MADVELLPLPEKSEIDRHLPTGVRVYGYTANDMRSYARANVAHATAPLQAENERLRAEVERLKSMTAVTMGVGSGGGNLFVHGDYESIKAAQALVFHAERLAEALREWWSAHRPVGWTEDQHRARPYVNLITVADKALTEALLRDQEARND